MCNYECKILIYGIVFYYRFATQERNGLLLYNGRYNEMHDFIALELIDGQVQFSFSLGTDITRVQVSVPGGVSDGNFHEVFISYVNRVSTNTWKN